MVGCSFEVVSGTSPDVGEDETGMTSASGTGATGGEVSSDTSGVTPTGPGSSGIDPSEPTASGPDETDGAPTGGIDVDIGCPEQPPEGWVLCEDFEDIDDPAGHFSRWQGDGVALGTPGHESPTAFEVTHFAGERWSGTAELRFGSGPPDNNVAAPDSQFDEIWVRFHTRVDEGWPIAGPGDLVELEGVTNGGATTFISRVAAPQDEPQLWGGAFSCVDGDHVNCDGVEDWNDLVWLGSQQGQSPVFEEPTAQEWTCVVIHARLNSPGQQDGTMDVLVGGTLDSQVLDLDYRGVRDDLGFNRIGLPSFMEYPLQDTHRRYIDDLVVSTTPLDCDEFI